MSIQYTERTAKFESAVSIEEADGLMEWIRNHPKGKVNLAKCIHLHAANLQVLMAMRPSIGVWPEDENLKQWLASAMA